MFYSNAPNIILINSPVRPETTLKIGGIPDNIKTRIPTNNDIEEIFSLYRTVRHGYHNDFRER